jgi:hypothetical protein
MIVIPPFTYWTVKLWLEGETSDWPDIDHAWKLGLQALEEHGVDIHTTPVFLVLGPRDESDVESLLKAAQLNLAVRVTPPEFAALHWAASADAIYLVCTTTSCLAELSRRGVDHAVAAPAGGGAAAAGLDTIRGTLIAGAPTAAPAVESPSITATAVPDYRGTMVASFGGGNATMLPGGGPSRSASVVSQLPKADVNLQQARLEYVCSLLRKVRQPVCPANGVLTLLPFSLIQHSDLAASAVRFAVQHDLERLVQGLRLRCPVVALVGQMESEAGFQELVRRVGPSKAKAQRFGKGFNIWNPPLAEQIEAVSTHACGAFEDFTYALFREPGGLLKVRNKQLYALLCKVRNRLRTRLEDVLVNAYAYDGDQKEDGPPEKLLFSGCYFAATGDREDQQAFVKSVFQKLLEEESELDWTNAAMVEDRRYQRWANMALAVASIAGLAIVAILALRFSGYLTPEGP